MYNATFNNISVISWQSILLVKETEVSVENHQPVASHWQYIKQQVVNGQLIYPSPKSTNLYIKNYCLYCLNCVFEETVVVMIILLLDLQLHVHAISAYYH